MIRLLATSMPNSSINYRPVANTFAITEPVGKPICSCAHLLTQPGYDQIDPEAYIKRGITLTYTLDPIIKATTNLTI